jgi:hypothetical protein
MTDEVPEADALEQELPAGGPPASTEPSLGSDVPIADALEQELPARGPIAGDELVEPEPGIAAEAPEADAIEQAQPGPLLEEDEAPR